MKIKFRIAAIFGPFPLLLSLIPCDAVAVPVLNLTALTAAITRDFSDVNEMRTVHLRDEPGDWISLSSAPRVVEDSRLRY